MPRKRAHGEDWGREMSDDHEQQRRDLEEREQRALEALRHAQLAGVSREDLIVLAYEAGVGSTFYKEIK